MARVLVFLFLVAVCLSSGASALPCFPGAEGFGTQTPGGRGGRVMVVTTLDDDGPGSLREACAAKGPRMVVFGVGGVIRLKSTLRVTEPFVTIAGQSAPGKGICIRDAGISVETHDVVMRFIRVRVGPSLVEEFNHQNCLEVTGEGSYNVVIDHCSFSWGLDENVGIVSQAHDATFSYNIISEPLRQPFTPTKIGKDRSHAMAMILGNHPDRCSVHHNLIAHANSRNPRIQGGMHEFANNVVYDWGFLTATFSRDPQVNFVGNYYKSGPSSRPMEMIVADNDIGSVYVSGNVAPSRTGADEWRMLTTADASHRATTPFPTAPLTIQPAELAYPTVLRQAGCRLPALDDVDARVIRQASLGMGAKIDRPAEVGGYPDYPVAHTAEDSDRDGMPDEYELRTGLNPRSAVDASRDSGSGYTSLENYLNSLADDASRDHRAIESVPVREAAADSPYAVMADGKPVPVERSDAMGGVYIARFGFSGTVRAVVVSSASNDLELTPERYRDRASQNGTAVSFDVFQPGPRVIAPKSRNAPPLVLIADDVDMDAPRPGDAGVRDVSACAGVPDATVALQRALDASAKRAGTVYFGPGVYHTETLRVGDRVTVYLAPGAAVKASGGPAFLMQRCSGARILGGGVIESSEASAIEITGCTGARVEGVVVMSSGGSAVNVSNCRRTRIYGVTTFADTAAVVLDASPYTSLERLFAASTGDAVVVATRDTGEPVRGLRIRDCVALCGGTAFRIAGSNSRELSDVLLQDCDAIYCWRGIDVTASGGAQVSDITFRDIRLSPSASAGDPESGRAIRVSNASDKECGVVRDMLFDRVTSTAANSCVFEGSAASKLDHFDFWGCRFSVTPGRPDSGKSAVLRVRHAKNFTLKLAYLHWQGEDSRNWSGFIGDTDSENIFVRELEETHEN